MQFLKEQWTTAYVKLRPIFRTENWSISWKTMSKKILKALTLGLSRILSTILVKSKHSISNSSNQKIWRKTQCLFMVLRMPERQSSWKSFKWSFHVRSLFSNMVAPSISITKSRLVMATLVSSLLLSLLMKLPLPHWLTKVQSKIWSISWEAMEDHWKSRMLNQQEDNGLVSLSSWHQTHSMNWCSQKPFCKTITSLVMTRKDVKTKKLIEKLWQTEWRESILIRNMLVEPNFLMTELILPITCTIYTWQIVLWKKDLMCWSLKMRMIQCLSILAWIKSIPKQTWISVISKLKLEKSKTMIQFLERDQSKRALLMKKCLKNHFRRASESTRETILCLSRQTASRSTSPTIVSLIICMRSTTIHTISDLWFEKELLVCAY